MFPPGPEGDEDCHPDTPACGPSTGSSSWCVECLGVNDQIYCMGHINGPYCDANYFCEECQLDSHCGADQECVKDYPDNAERGRCKNSGCMADDQCPEFELCDEDINVCYTPECSGTGNFGDNECQLSAIGPPANDRYFCDVNRLCQPCEDDSHCGVNFVCNKDVVETNGADSLYNECLALIPA